MAEEEKQVGEPGEKVDKRKGEVLFAASLLLVLGLCVVVGCFALAALEGMPTEWQMPFFLSGVMLVLAIILLVYSFTRIRGSAFVRNIKLALYDLVHFFNPYRRR